MKTKTRPHTHEKKCCFRQARIVQVLLHVCCFESARHLPSQMLLGANADHAQPLQHVFCIYQRMYAPLRGILYINGGKYVRLRGGGGEGFVCVFQQQLVSLASVWPSRKRNNPTRLHFSCFFESETTRLSAHDGQIWLLQSCKEAQTVTTCGASVALQRPPCCCVSLRNNIGLGEWQC